MQIQFLPFPITVILHPPNRSTEPSTSQTQKGKPSFVEALGGQEVYEKYAAENADDRQKRLNRLTSELVIAIQDLDDKRVESLLKRGASTNHDYSVLHQLVDAWYLKGTKDIQNKTKAQKIAQSLVALALCAVECCVLLLEGVQPGQGGSACATWLTTSVVNNRKFFIVYP